MRVYSLLTKIISVISVMVAGFFFMASHASAATLTVNSKADSTADDGSCTLREAITAANTDTASGALSGEYIAGSGTDTINFNISGTADFTNGGQNGYTITPTSTLLVTQTVIINGYTQPGSSANTAPAPQPINSILLIELDQSSSGGIQLNADNIVVRGLVMNSSSGTGVLAGGDNIEIKGNYIGTNPQGTSAKANTLNGINASVSGFDDPDNLIIGGASPVDRNIVSGNTSAGITPNIGDDNWVIKGNYIGVGRDGMTAIPNSSPNSPGALSLDNSTGHIIGGTEAGATNVISGNGSFGPFPDNISNVLIQGNIIGPDWQGNPIAGASQQGGIGLPPIAGPIYNTLIGGVSPSAGNHIAYNQGPGIAVLNVAFNGTPLFTTYDVAILGNSIHDNTPTGASFLSASGLGIEHMLADVGTVTFTNLGPNLNDSTDSDTGPNNYMNFPVINSATQTGTNLTVNFDLDAADSTNGEYRVEFFANDVTDPSGYGEGQTYLGATTVANGLAQEASITLANGMDLTGRSITATTTAISNITTSGYGSTSEFSGPITALVTATSTGFTSDQLASTGDNLWLWLTGALSLIGVGVYVARFVYRWN
jgi:CSLREA domain-containing protein